MGRRPNPPCTALGFPFFEDSVSIPFFWAHFFEILVMGRRPNPFAWPPEGKALNCCLFIWIALQ